MRWSWRIMEIQWWFWFVIIFFDNFWLLFFLFFLFCLLLAIWNFKNLFLYMTVSINAILVSEKHVFFHLFFTFSFFRWIFNRFRLLLIKCSHWVVKSLSKCRGSYFFFVWLLKCWLWRKNLGKNLFLRRICSWRESCMTFFLFL